MFLLRDKTKNTIHIISATTAEIISRPKETGSDLRRVVIENHGGVRQRDLFDGSQVECEFFVDALFEAMTTARGAVVQQLAENARDKARDFMRDIHHVPTPGADDHDFDGRDPFAS
jgi:hypothetical protein